MKVIQAMKQVKANKEKIVDLQQKIKANAANLSFETPVYGDNAEAQLREWLQSCTDTVKENIRLLTAISKTNHATQVTIELGDNQVTKTVAEWVWRRREYAGIDQATWHCLSDRGLKEGNLPTTTGAPMEVKIIRHYDPALRDKMVAMFGSEVHKIDGALEVSNAITDLIE